MSAPLSPRDFELLSAHLDGQLTPAEGEALLARLEHEPQLTAAFKQLQRTRTLLRRAPQRRLPRSFMLTPHMAGQRQRGGLGSWSGFNFASAIAALALILVLVTDFSINGLPLPAAEQEPMLMMAEAPQAESYAAGSEAAGSEAADSGPANAAESSEPLMLESAAAEESLQADELPSAKMAPAFSLSAWVAHNARTLEILFASLAIIAGVFAWKMRRNHYDE